MIKQLHKWKLSGFWPYTPLMGKSMELGENFKNLTPWIDAQVPGSIYQDLYRAGLIEDPYYESNSVKCEWVSNRWWIYTTTVQKEFELDEDERVELVFEGIDYKAYVYINGRLSAARQGMFHELRLDLTDEFRKTDKCRINVVFESIPEEMSQIGRTSQVKILKSRFGYKWDFCSRLVNIGLYGDAYLRTYRKFVMRSYHFMACRPLENGQAELEMEIEATQGGQASFDVDLHTGSDCHVASAGPVELRPGMNHVTVNVQIPHPALWYPNGSGAQTLYDLTVTASEDGGIPWEILKSRVGFCQKEFVKNEDASEDSLPYTFVINGHKTYVKGVNLTPLDMLYGCVETGRYRMLLKQLKRANINLIRIWGGGIIETESFYNLCDEYGFMVWQEFIQSGSGLDNVPSRDENFLRELQSMATQAVQQKRNHVSLTVWSGGNELTDDKGVPVTFDDPNIALLKSIVDHYDSGRFMLPSSPSGPNFFGDTKKTGGNHDIHGPWKYLGPKEHNPFFDGLDSQFHSEFGCDGMSCEASIRKFISDKNLTPMNMRENYVWRHHGEWWDTYDREAGIFGEIRELDVLCRLSQVVQAEALCYAVESNRRRAFRNSGCIIWQADEPYPNVSCTSLVDYYMVPKLAMLLLRNAYASFQATMKYPSFILDNGSLDADVFLTNDGDEAPISARCTVTDGCGAILNEETFTGVVGNGRTVKAGHLHVASAYAPESFRVCLHTERTGDSVENDLLFLVRGQDGLCKTRPALEFYEEMLRKYGLHDSETVQ